MRRTHNPVYVGSNPTPATNKEMTMSETKKPAAPIKPQAQKPAPKQTQKFVPKNTVMRKAGRGR